MSRIEAHAKVNLRHRVFARDESGYHGVETLLARTSLSDTVALADAPGEISIRVDGPFADGVPGGSGNLCWTAASGFLERAFPNARSRPGVRLALTKRIPHGSGLGGGSADAAGTLRLLAARWPKLDEREVVALAGEIGSDVAFGLIDVPLALGWERGRRLLPLRSPPPLPALLVCPAVRISTPAAYEWLRTSRGPAEDPGGSAVLPGPARLGEWEAVERLVRNDLEAPVLERHPVLRGVLEQVRATAPRVAGMTGSGSTLFALFEDEPSRERAREHLAAEGLPAGTQTVRVSLPI